MRRSRHAATLVVVVIAAAGVVLATHEWADRLFDGPALEVAASVTIGLVVAASVIVLGPGRHARS